MHYKDSMRSRLPPGYTATRLYGYKRTLQGFDAEPSTTRRRGDLGRGDICRVHSAWGALGVEADGVHTAADFDRRVLDGVHRCAGERRGACSR